MTIVASGGGLVVFVDYLLGLTGKDDPGVCCLGTATGDAFVPALRGSSVRCRPSHVGLFGIPRPDWREHLLSAT